MRSPPRELPSYSGSTKEADRIVAVLWNTTGASIATIPMFSPHVTRGIIGAIIYSPAIVRGRSAGPSHFPERPTVSAKPSPTAPLLRRKTFHHWGYIAARGPTRRAGGCTGIALHWSTTSRQARRMFGCLGARGSHTLI